MAMARLKDTDDFEEFDSSKFCDWLRFNKASEDVICVIAENEIDGRTFLDLNLEDLKDISASFKVRKEIRRFLEQLNEEESDECNTPPQFRKRKRSPSPSDLPVLQRPLKKPASLNTTRQILDASDCFVPKSDILENASQYSQQSVETERRRVVRLAMDNLIGQNGGRPSEGEIQNLARMMASQYPCLRDRPLEGLRDNFEKDNEDCNEYDNINSNVVQKKAERKPLENLGLEALSEVTGAGKRMEEKTMAQEESVKKTLKTAEEKISEEKNKDEERTENDTENKPTDKATESLTTALKKCVKASSSEQLIRLTIDERLREIEKIPVKERIQYILKTYKVFSQPESVIFNMYMQVPVELDKMRSNLENLMTTSLDMLFDKNIIKIPRSALKTTDQKYFVALFHLPILCGNTKSGKLKPGHHLVHVVKSSEMWSEVAQSHKGSTGPWILHNTIGSNTSTTLMERDDAIFKCSGAEEAILALVGIYYMGSMPYPSQITGPLLLLQHLVLEDKVHDGDLPTLQKAKKEFDAYKARSENHSVDSFF